MGKRVLAEYESTERSVYLRKAVADGVTSSSFTDSLKSMINERADYFNRIESYRPSSDATEHSRFIISPRSVRQCYCGTLVVASQGAVLAAIELTKNNSDLSLVDAIEQRSTLKADQVRPMTIFYFACYEDYVAITRIGENDPFASLSFHYNHLVSESNLQGHMTYSLRDIARPEALEPKKVRGVELGGKILRPAGTKVAPNESEERRHLAIPVSAVMQFLKKILPLPDTDRDKVKAMLDSEVLRAVLTLRLAKGKDADVREVVNALANAMSDLDPEQNPSAIITSSGKIRRDLLYTSDKLNLKRHKTKLVLEQTPTYEALAEWVVNTSSMM